jgi:hypothetical protein
MMHSRSQRASKKITDNSLVDLDHVNFSGYTSSRVAPYRRPLENERWNTSRVSCMRRKCKPSVQPAETAVETQGSTVRNCQGNQRGKREHAHRTTGRSCTQSAEETTRTERLRHSVHVSRRRMVFQYPATSSTCIAKECTQSGLGNIRNLKGSHSLLRVFETLIEHTPSLRT